MSWKHLALRDKHLGAEEGGGGEEGVFTSYNKLFEKAPPKRGSFSRLDEYKRVVISQAEV